MLQPPHDAASSFVNAIPFVGVAHAGFPSPATDYLRERVSLDKMFIKHPSSTFLCRVSGDRLKDFGVAEGDLAIVDRSLNIELGRIVVIGFRGELVLARAVEGKHGALLLQSANPLHPFFDAWEEEAVQLWGVITHVVKKLL